MPRPAWPGFWGNHLSCGSYQFHHRSRGSSPRGRPGPAVDREPVCECGCARVPSLPPSWQPWGGPHLCPRPGVFLSFRPRPRLLGEGAGPAAFPAHPAAPGPHCGRPLPPESAYLPCLASGTQAARVDLPPSGPAARAQRPSPRLSLSLSCTAGRWLLAGRPHPTARPMLASPMLPPPPRPLPENSFQAGNFWGFAGLVGDRAALTSRPVLHAPSTSAVFAASRGASVAPAGLCDMGPGRGATSGPAPLEGSLGLASQGPQNTPGGGEGCSPTLGNPLTPATA